ncbi:MAG: methyltransferase domain-containing protein [Reinekea sp.]
MVKRLGRRFKQLYRHGPGDIRRQEALLSDWYRSPLGMELISHERELVSRAISGRFGSAMVQLDSGFHETLFEKRLFGSGVIVSQLENRALCPVVCARPENLPFVPESLDMLLMHHTLDVCENPYQAVREAATVLKPGGLMIIIGFNPFSSWGLRALMQSRKGGLGVWNSRFIRAGRVEDWMNLLDFEVERQEKHIFIPPMTRPGWLRRSAYGYRIQRRILPFTGGVYLLVGYKLVGGKLPLTEKKHALGFLDSVVSVNTKNRI